MTTTPPDSDRPRIAFLMPGYGVVNRGAERFLDRLLHALPPRYDVTVLSRAPAAPGRVHVAAVPREHRLTCALDRLPLVGHALRTFLLNPLHIEWLSASLSAERWLRAHPVDLFVPEAGVWGARLGRRLRRRQGTPFVDIGHGAAARQRPDRYVASTRVSLDEVRRRVPDVRGAVIPMGVDTSRFRPDIPPRALPLSPPVVLAAGALEPMKRMPLTIDAVAALEGASLLLAGTGPEAAALDAHALRRLGPARYRRVAAAPGEMPALYTAADVVTLPSETEAFGLVYLEGMAANRPAVAPDDACRREVIGEAGLFCDCADPAAYAAALRAALARRWNDIPRQRALRFDWSRVGAAYDTLFREVLAETRRP